MEETRKRGTPCKKWNVKVREDLNIKGIKTDRYFSETVETGERRRRRRRRRRRKGKHGCELFPLMLKIWSPPGETGNHEV